jgi:molybdopterin molybdotransferase
VLKALEDHLQDLVGLVPPTPTGRADLVSALGCVLAEDVATAAPLPPFTSSAMDGYAVRVGDVPGRLTVVGDVPAGTIPTAVVDPGTCLRIMTGALIPEGTEAIVPIEDVTVDGDEIIVTGGTTAGVYVRPAGSDAAPGTVVLCAGTRITASRIAVLASAGTVTPLVHRRPRVLVVSTGDELVDAGTAPGPAQLVDSNRPTLLALAREAGCEAIDGGRVGDSAKALLEALAGGEDIDLVVTSGGVSVGAYDVVKAALLPLGTVRFERVGIQPGLPQAWGHLSDGRPFLGLPGNPVSAVVSWELFGRAALGVPRRRTRATLAQAVHGSPRDKVQLLRVRIAEGRASPVGGTGSHLLAALGQADAVAVIPVGVTTLPAGTEVEVIGLGGSLGP